MKMKSILIILVILGCTKIGYAQEENVSSSPKFNFETIFANEYAWRGITYDEGLVVQPALTMSLDKWTFQIWGNIAAVEKDEFPKNHELDFLAQYSFEFGDLTLSPYLLYYIYPDQEEDAALELCLSAYYPVGDFTIGTTLSRDIKLGIPYLFGYHDVSYEKELNEDLSANASAGFGWGSKNFNRYYVGMNKGALNYVFADLSLNYALNESIVLKPFAEFYFITDSEIKDLTNSDIVNFGLSVSIDF